MSTHLEHTHCTRHVAIIMAVASTILVAACGGQESATPANAPDQNDVQITLRTVPDPPRTGDNQFEATVKDSAGNAIANADVTVVLFMAAMPSMNMPEMRHEVKLQSSGGGSYTGTGNVMSAGAWDATVVVKQNGTQVAEKKFTIQAK